MPAALVDLSDITLDQTVTKYLETKRSSTGTAYEKCLKRFVKFYGRPFKDFLNHVEGERKANLDRPIHEKVRPGEDVIREFIKWHTEAGYANLSVHQSLGALQNILKFYAIPVSYEFIETPPARPMKINDKHEWTLDQVRAFVEAAEYIRDKAYIMFGVQSGLSIGDILALNYGDIKREFEAGVMPMAITGYRAKTNIEIRTFVGYDAIYYLKMYLQSRPKLEDDEPIFKKLGSDERATTGSIQRKLKDYADKLEFLYEEDLQNGYNPARPHSLRSAFRSRLTGKMDGDLIECFMAHDIGQEKSTYMNQPLDELREIYANYEHLLAIHHTSLDEVKAAEQVIPEDIKDELKSLDTTLTMLTQKNTGQSDEIEKLRQKNRELEAKLEENRTQRDTVKKMLEDMQARLEALEKKKS